MDSDEDFEYKLITFGQQGNFAIYVDQLKDGTCVVTALHKSFFVWSKQAIGNLQPKDELYHVPEGFDE